MLPNHGCLTFEERKYENDLIYKNCFRQEAAQNDQRSEVLSHTLKKNYTIFFKVSGCKRFILATFNFFFFLNVESHLNLFI